MHHRIDPETRIISQRASLASTPPRNFRRNFDRPPNLATFASRAPQNNCGHSLLSPRCPIKKHPVFRSLYPTGRRHVCSHHVAAAQLSLSIGVQTLAPRLRHQRTVHSSHFIPLLFRVRGQHPVHLHLQLRAVPLSGRRVLHIAAQETARAINMPFELSQLNRFDSYIRVRQSRAAPVTHSRTAPFGR